MSVELLYTSAERGLRQGSRGFCTVVSTSGTPLNLASRLEALSGYRHQYPIESPHYNDNPVALSHVRMTIAGRPLSVISRIAAYEADYSGRTNKLAHHIVVEPHEAAPAGPAWLLMQPGVMREHWDGNCIALPAGPVLPMGDQQAARCQNWEAVTGDAAWGGVVADAWLNPASKPTWLIYPAAQHGQLLELMNESIALLPAPNRWQATFSTYALTVPPDVQCRVRCVPDDSQEARFAAARGQVIRLQPTAFDRPITPLVAAARGEAIANPSPIATQSAAQASSTRLAKESRPRRTATAAGPPPVQSGNAPPPPPQPASSSRVAPPPIERRTPSAAKRLFVILGLAIGLVSMLTVAGIVVVRSQRTPDATDAKMLSMGTDPSPQTPAQQSPSVEVPPAAVDDAPSPTVDDPQPQENAEPVPPPPTEPSPKKETEPVPSPTADGMQSSAAEAEVPVGGHAQGVQAEETPPESEDDSPSSDRNATEKHAVEPTEKARDDSTKEEGGVKEIEVIVTAEDAVKAGDKPHSIVLGMPFPNYETKPAQKPLVLWREPSTKNSQPRKGKAELKSESLRVIAAPQKGQVDFEITILEHNDFVKRVNGMRKSIARLKVHTTQLEQDCRSAKLPPLPANPFAGENDRLFDWLAGNEHKKEVEEFVNEVNRIAGVEKNEEANKTANGEEDDRLGRLTEIQNKCEQTEDKIREVVQIRNELVRGGPSEPRQLLDIYPEERTGGGLRKTPKPIETIKIRFLIRLEDFSR